MSAIGATKHCMLSKLGNRVRRWGCVRHEAQKSPRRDIFINFQQHNFLFSLFSALRPFQSNDDKEKANSPFESNGIKKDDQVNASNGVAVNGIDDDKGFK